jgi:transposase, IS30 family
MVRFSNAQVAEAVQPFWAALQAGEFISDAAVAAGTYRKQGTRWVAVCGGVRPRRGRDLKGRCLSFAEREEIALGRARGETIRVIARRLGRSPSTISRELKRNADRRDGGYRATTAHALAYERASRPKPAKLATNLALRAIVPDDLQRRLSPEQILLHGVRDLREDHVGVGGERLLALVLAEVAMGRGRLLVDDRLEHVVVHVSVAHEGGRR